jgi:hypothetical protein
MAHEHLSDEETANKHDADEEDPWANYDEFEEVEWITEEEKEKEIDEILELEKNIEEWKHRKSNATAIKMIAYCIDR